MYLQTTDVPASRSIAEVSAILMRSGATEILTELAGGQVVGIKFALLIKGERVPFALPARTAAIFAKLQSQRPVRAADSKLAIDGRKRDEQQAPMIAWRQLLMWLKAQLALIDTDQVEAGQVFLPYQVLANGDTVYERVKALGQQKLNLPALPAQPAGTRS